MIQFVKNLINCGQNCPNNTNGDLSKIKETLKIPYKDFELNLPIFSNSDIHCDEKCKENTKKVLNNICYGAEFVKNDKQNKIVEIKCGDIDNKCKIINNEDKYNIVGNLKFYRKVKNDYCIDNTFWVSDKGKLSCDKIKEKNICDLDGTIFDNKYVNGKDIFNNKILVNNACCSCGKGSNLGTSRIINCFYNEECKKINIDEKNNEKFYYYELKDASKYNKDWCIKVNDDDTIKIFCTNYIPKSEISDLFSARFNVTTPINYEGHLSVGNNVKNNYKINKNNHGIILKEDLIKNINSFEIVKEELSDEEKKQRVILSNDHKFKIKEIKNKINYDNKLDNLINYNCNDNKVEYKFEQKPDSIYSGTKKCDKNKQLTLKQCQNYFEKVKKMYEKKCHIKEFLDIECINMAKELDIFTKLEMKKKLKKRISILKVSILLEEIKRYHKIIDTDTILKHLQDVFLQKNLKIVLLKNGNLILHIILILVMMKYHGMTK